MTRHALLLGWWSLLAAAGCGAGARPHPVVAPGAARPSGSWLERREKHFVLRYREVDASRVAGLSSRLTAGCRTVERFFGRPFRRRFVVYVMPSRAELTALWRRLWRAPALKPECWMVASGREDLLALLSPRVWPTAACEHDAADERHVQNLLTHELTHTYHDQHNPRRDFEGMEPLAWLAEGLAAYVSGQLEEGHQLPATEAVQRGLAPARLAEAHRGRYRYGVSGSLVRFLDVSRGRELLRRLLAVVDQAGALALIGQTEGELLRDWRAHVAGASRSRSLTNGRRGKH